MTPESIFLNVRAALRFIRFLAAILVFFIRATFYYHSTNDPVLRRRKLTQNGTRAARGMMRAFNVGLICNQPLPENEVSLLVGNHVGFIDIVCLNAACNAVSITSLEMKNTPVLGQISELGGCAYVDRKNRMRIQDELRGIVDVLKQGFRVVLYAESVASNGEQVLPFKKTLLMSAGLAGKPIRPFVFNFVNVNGAPVRFEHRDSLCWYGDETFFPAIWRSLKLDSLTCEIEFLPLVHTTPDDDRTEVATKVRDMVAARYRPFYPGMNAAGSTARTELATNNL